jgi:succinate dehydrogenase/fumarate reductase flavoprotein subunit
VIKSKIDYNYVARAMAFEAKQGRGPFYVDFSLVQEEKLWFLKAVTGWMELHRKKLEKEGIGIFEHQEMMPGFLNSQGIKTDKSMATCVHGLYAAGRARFFEPGVLMGGFNTAMCTAFGCWAGESAGNYARGKLSPNLDTSIVNREKKGLYGPLGLRGVEPRQALFEIQDAIFRVEVLILKNEEGLSRALEEIRRIRKEVLPAVGARDIHYLVRLKEVENMALIAELMLTAALKRTESRGAHYREDYPQRDDENWLRWLDLRLKGGELTLNTTPVPLEKYKFKPTRYYMDNFRMPGV